MKKIPIILLVLLFNSFLFADDKMEIGLEIYNNKAACGTCHTLKSAESSGDIGPNLDMLKPQLDQIVYAVKNGIGLMPPWKGVLMPEEIEAVAYYVFTSTNK